MAHRDLAIQFLAEWKPASRIFIDFVPRQKNLEGLKTLGITIKIARGLLQSLSIENYVSGPELDRDKGTVDIWVFGLPLDKTEVYIKIKMFDVKGRARCKCLSFHPAEKRLSYPHAGGVRHD